MVRHEARMEFEKLGREASPWLIKILKEGGDDARWEAAKALITIKDPETGDNLVEALSDEDYEIQWLAAEALIALNKAAIEPLLRGLVERPESESLRNGAHHVLHDLERQRHLRQPVLEVLDDIRTLGPWEHVAVLAREALKTIKKVPAETVEE
jgi:HEAT repeat protein